MAQLESHQEQDDPRAMYDQGVGQKGWGEWDYNLVRSLSMM